MTSGALSFLQPKSTIEHKINKLCTVLIVNKMIGLNTT
jgi:hypothetical protein